MPSNRGNGVLQDKTGNGSPNQIGGPLSAPFSSPTVQGSCPRAVFLYETQNGLDGLVFERVCGLCPDQPCAIQVAFSHLNPFQSWFRLCVSTLCQGPAA